MTLQESIYQHLGILPKNLHAEVLDFILFLEHRYTPSPGEACREKKSLAEMLLEIPPALKILETER
jgi:hypothetical protein